MKGTTLKSKINGALFVIDGEFEELKRDAHAHRMNISEYLRWLIDKQRKEDEGK